MTDKTDAARARTRMPRWIVPFVLAVGVVVLASMIVLPTMQAADDVRAGGLGWPYVAVLIWRDLQAWLYRLDWTTVFGAVLVVGTIVIFWRMSQSETSSFDFADAFAGENGKSSMSKIGYFFGMMGGTWFLVTYTISGDMTETYFGYYLTAFVAGKGITEIAGVFRQAQIARTVEAGGNAPPSSPDPQPDRASDPDPSNPPPQPVRTADAGGRRPRGKHE